MAQIHNSRSFIVIALGGSLIAPRGIEHGVIDIGFLKRFRSFLLRELRRKRRFCLVIGGGKITRQYQHAASKVVSVPSEDLDWIGVHATRLNAHLLRTIFYKEAYPVIVDHDPTQQEADALFFQNRNLIIASGWKPGWSTDYVTVRLAQKLRGKEVIIAGDTSFVYDKDPKKFPSAKPVKEISWPAYAKLIPKKWSPGLSSPVDPVATQFAKTIGLKAKILKGSDLKNFGKAIKGEPFVGTLIE
ncbi:MAG: UMP kinase [bacterium]|nr:UMP kinase [bacterium]